VTTGSMHLVAEGPVHSARLAPVRHIIPPCENSQLSPHSSCSVYSWFRLSRPMVRALERVWARVAGMPPRTSRCWITTPSRTPCRTSYKRWALRIREGLGTSGLGTPGLGTPRGRGREGSACWISCLTPIWRREGFEHLRAQQNLQVARGHVVERSGPNGSPLGLSGWASPNAESYRAIACQARLSADSP
jgi:hypothetical protein